MADMTTTQAQADKLLTMAQAVAQLTDAGFNKNDAAKAVDTNDFTVLYPEPAPA